MNGNRTKKIDLRSDTVTHPTVAMRKAMADAEVGDDVYGEDPTLNHLQEMLAERAGFEAGLFMPTGSMSNQVALATHTGRGEEVIAPEGAHIYEYEIGAFSVVSGLVPRLVRAPLGVPEVADIRAAIHRNIHQAPTGLISLENTHNHAGGTVLPTARAQEISQLAKEEGLPLHLDGARAFNAAAALEVPIAEICVPFDSASLCLSKGLAAPVGTVLLGSAEFIKRAHRYRKLLGGGMRQAGGAGGGGYCCPRDHDRAPARGPRPGAASRGRARRTSRRLCRPEHGADQHDLLEGRKRGRPRAGVASRGHPLQHARG